MRIFVLPVGMLKDLKKGAPGLDDALGRPLYVNEDPELHVQRDDADEPAAWRLVVSSESTWQPIALDADNYSAMRVAISIYLVGLVEAIGREHPWVVAEMNIEAMVVELLKRARQRAS